MKKIVWLFCLGLPGLSLAGQSLTEQYFINDAPINWYYIHQDMIKSSTFKSDFVASMITIKINPAIFSHG